jgi:tetratricopeptide (TPR) repeat protein
MNNKLQHVILGVLTIGLTAALLEWSGSGDESTGGGSDFLRFTSATKDSRYIGSEIRSDGSSSVRETGIAIRHAENRQRIADAGKFASREDYSKAESLYREILQATPDESIAKHELGTVLFFQRRYAESKIVYEDLLRQDPRFIRAQNGLGAISRVQGRYFDAIGHYSLVIESNPSSALAHYGRGVSYFNIGKFKEAEADLRRTKDLLPKESDMSIEARAFIEKIEASKGRIEVDAPERR